MENRDMYWNAYVSRFWYGFSNKRIVLILKGIKDSFQTFALFIFHFSLTKTPKGLETKLSNKQTMLFVFLSWRWRNKFICLLFGRSYCSTIFTLVKNSRIYTVQYTFPILLLNDDNMLGEHKGREKNVVYGRLF